MITDPLASLCLLALVVVVALQLEKKLKVFRALGAALVAILLGMVLSNTGLIPGTSPTYDFLMGTGVNVGIALILLNVDIRSVLSAGPRMLGAFGIGAVGTAAGAFVGALLLSGLVGPETWKLAGQFTGTYTGGGVNFAALGEAFDTSPEMFSAATAADVIVTAIWMITCLAVPVILGRGNGGVTESPSDSVGTEGLPKTLEHSLVSSGRVMSILDAAGLVTIAVCAVWTSQWLGGLIPRIPSVLWLTTIVLIAAQIPAVKSLAGSGLFGNYLLLLFLASNGARSVVTTMLEIGPSVFYFAVITVAFHGAVIFGIGLLCRLDLPTLAVASQANVGGAASAMAIASARGYKDRLLPGVAVGLLGYAAGNYSGFALASVIRGILGQ